MMMQPTLGRSIVIVFEIYKPNPAFLKLQILHLDNKVYSRFDFWNVIESKIKMTVSKYAKF